LCRLSVDVTHSLIPVAIMFGIKASPVDLAFSIMQVATQFKVFGNTGLLAMLGLVVKQVCSLLATRVFAVRGRCDQAYVPKQ
jgi:multidrug efflux pump subunit AcrB